MYSDENGTTQIEAPAVLPATGHTYNSPIWSWVKKNGEYTVSVKFKCPKCGDIVDVDTEPTLTETDNGSGVKTYTASITYEGKEYTSTRDEQIGYNITIDNDTNYYNYGEQIKAVASTYKDGLCFAGWYEGNTLVSASPTYYFYATREMNIRAEYNCEAVEAQPVYTLNVSERTKLADNKQKVSFTVDCDLPDGCILVNAGLVRSYVNDDPVIGGEKVTVKTSTLKNKRGTYKLSLTLSAANAENTIYSKGYVTYLDSEKVAHTVYTEMFTSLSAN